MTHMHIPDGVLPVWLWLAGFIIMALVLGLSLYRLRSMDLKKKIPLLGALSAAMLVAMTIPVFPGYHINLSVITGILIGPSLGVAAAFITNLILALMGHGGITVIGLNTLLLATEAVMGHLLFSILKKPPVFWRAAAATIVTLFCTTLILIGMVALSNIDPDLLHHAEEGASGFQEHRASVSTFALLVLSIGAIGWFIEAAITGAVVKFIAQVKPDLLQHILHSTGKSRKR